MKIVKLFVKKNGLLLCELKIFNKSLYKKLIKELKKNKQLLIEESDL